MFLIYQPLNHFSFPFQSNGSFISILKVKKCPKKGTFWLTQQYVLTMTRKFRNATPGCPHLWKFVPIYDLLRFFGENQFIAVMLTIKIIFIMTLLQYGSQLNENNWSLFDYDNDNDWLTDPPSKVGGFRAGHHICQLPREHRVLSMSLSLSHIYQLHILTK